MNKYTTDYTPFQTRTGNGQYSTSRHVATVAELNEKAKQAQRERSETDKALAAKFGEDVDCLFA